MFLNNSYFNVLRKIDRSWEERQSSRSPEKGRYKFWKRRLSRSSSSSTLKSHTCSNSFSSGESGLYSGDVNSGYYGDDENDPCPKCNRDLPIGGVRAEIDDYDVISIEVNVRKSKIINAGKTDLGIANPESIDFEEFVVIPSSREEFCSGNFKHITPKHTANIERDLDNKNPGTSNHVFVTCTPRVTVSLPCSELDVNLRKNCTQGTHSSCSCIGTPQKPIRFRLYAPPRSSSDTSVWWKENIKWQLRQRNQTQTENFIQLREERTKTKPKVRINRELAHYLNKYGEFRPHNDALNTAFVETEPNVINQCEILDAIRSHSGKTTKLRSNSVAQRATAYMESQNLTKEDKSLKDTDEEDSGHVVGPLRRPRSKSKSQYRDRPLTPRWRESITNQLQMRNFLECKYFTDAIIRRTLSQLSISDSHKDSQSLEFLTDYDVITIDDVSRLQSNGKVVNTNKSISQGYHSAPPGVFTIRNLDLVYGQH